MLKYKKIVIKVGTKVITSKERALEKDRIRDIVGQISDAMDAPAGGGQALKAVLVTSGAIGAGTGLLGLKRRSSKLSELQAAASIGQSHLMRIYSEYFKERGYLAGQILLTQEDFNDRKRYLNIKHTIDALLAHKAVPVINENDTVATDEIRCGDNDRLSSLVSDLCQADLLIILTDVDGLLDQDGNVISVVEEITPKLLKLGGSSHCDLGTGGMATKIESARRVMGAGIECVIANGRSKDMIRRILAGERSGTRFISQRAGTGGTLIAKKRWIAFSARPKGAIKVDDGAKDALLKRDKSLLASGITGVSGNFKAGDVVDIVDAGGTEFARGLVSYSSGDLMKIKGMKTAAFKAALGYAGRDEAVHKDNLAIL